MRTVTFTCTNDLLDFHTGHVYFFGKLAHCLIGILICERINVDLHSWRHLERETGAAAADADATEIYGLYCNNYISMILDRWGGTNSQT